MKVIGLLLCLSLLLPAQILHVQTAGKAQVLLVFNDSTVQSPESSSPASTVTLTNGALGCTLTNNTGVVTIVCTGNGKTLYSSTVAQAHSLEFAFSVDLASDSLTVTLKSNGSGDWSWSAASNDNAYSGTL